MHIHWDINPLKSKVILDSVHIKLLKALIAVEYQQEIQMPIEGSSPKKALEAMILLSEFSQKNESGVSNFDIEVTRQLDQMTSALQDPHFGDCVAESGPCLKCHAESLLDVDTIKGLDKQAARVILYLFESKKEGRITPSDVIASLVSLISKENPEYFDLSVPVFPSAIFKIDISNFNNPATVRALRWITSYYHANFD